MKADRGTAVEPRVAVTYPGGVSQFAGDYDHALIVVISGFTGLYSWLVFVVAFDHDGLIGPR